jgi:hypothetical protein
LFIVSILQEEINVCRHSDINSLKSGLVHLTGQPHCKKSKSAKVKNGTVNLILRDYLIDRYKLDHSINVTIILMCCEKIQLLKKSEEIYTKNVL